MKKFYLLILGAFILNIFAQKPIIGAEKDLFYLDALNFYSPDSTKSRLDLYVEFPFDRLEFQHSKELTAFSSKIDLTIEIRDIEGREIVNKLYKEEVTTQKTEIEYLSRNSKIITKNYFLIPGHYKLKVTTVEQNTKKSSTAERDITIRDYLTEPISISDVMVISKVKEENNNKNITPNISRNVVDLDSFYIFFIVYKNNEDSKIDLNINVLDSKKEVVYHTTDFLDITTGIDFQNQVFIKIPLSNLSFDKYSLDLIALSSQNSTKISASFICINVDFPLSLDNIDVLIAQLQYIADDKEMDYMKDGQTDAEKQKRFLEFWKKKDPTSITKRNEVMMEYYKRLGYTNKHFSTSYKDGWKTDMGMIYIIFGMPSSVDRHPYEMDTKPYEVWDYYEINREFVFVDESGFGDYRLITPIYEDTKFKVFK